MEEHEYFSKKFNLSTVDKEEAWAKLPIRKDEDGAGSDICGRLKAEKRGGWWSNDSNMQ